MIAEEAWCCPHSGGSVGTWKAVGRRDRHLRRAALKNCEMPVAPWVAVGWETSVPAFKLANDGLSTGSKSNWIVQESPETGAANRFVLLLTSSHIIWIIPLTHTYCIYALQQKFLGPNKGPNMALTGLLMKRGGYARHRLLNWWNSFEFPSLAARWPAPNTVNPIHHNFCPQFSRVLAVREIRGYLRTKIGFGQTLKGFISLPGCMSYQRSLHGRLH